VVKCNTGYRANAMNCQPCNTKPSNSQYTPATSGQISSCDYVCNKGFTSFDGSSCLKCPKGTYKDQAGSFSCRPCSDATTSPEGSTSELNCTSVCSTIEPIREVLASKDPRVSTVTLLTAIGNSLETIRSAAAMASIKQAFVGQCLVGPSNDTTLWCWNSGTRSTPQDYCFDLNREGPITTTAAGINASGDCDIGFTSFDGITCVKCSQGTYKNQSGPFSCYSCNDGLSSPEGSSSVHNCTETCDTVEPIDEALVHPDSHLGIRATTLAHLVRDSLATIQSAAALTHIKQAFVDQCLIGDSQPRSLWCWNNGTRTDPADFCLDISQCTG